MSIRTSKVAPDGETLNKIEDLLHEVDSNEDGQIKVDTLLKVSNI